MVCVDFFFDIQHVGCHEEDSLQHTQKEDYHEEEEERGGGGGGGRDAPECFGSAVHDTRVALCEHVFVIFCKLQHVFEDQSLAARVR